MERKKLTTEEINERLKDLNEWTLKNEHLTRRFEFDDFAASLAFVNQAGAVAEKLDHHPDITFGWGYAEFSTTTHDRDGVTDFDFALAKEIDAI